MDTTVKGWLQSRTKEWLRRLRKYQLFQMSKGQRWRQRSGFPHCQNRCQDPVLTRHQAGIQPRLCVSVCMRQRNLATTFRFLIVFYLTTALPKVKVPAALENRKKTPTDSGLRANALCGCQDLRLAKSLFWSSLCCPFSGSLVARSPEQCWVCHWIYIYLVRSFGFRCFSRGPRGGHSLMREGIWQG